MGCIDKKISELVPLVVPAAGDLFAIVDVSVPGLETKQITVANFLAALPAAPLDAQYVTLALNPTLTNERVLTGTANQVIVTDGGAGGNVTLSTPQDIGILSTPTFGGLTINGNILVTGTVDGIDVSTLATTVGNIANAQFVTMALDATLANERVLIGTANQITVTDGGAGGNVTISLPSDINLTGASSIGTTAGALTLDPTTEVIVAGNLFVDGNADEVQLLVQANAAQTANILTIENSAGTDLAGADERGVLFSHAGIDVDSVYIGNDAGNIGHTNALYNVGIGKEVFRALSTGDNNVGIGYKSCYSMNTGERNAFVGAWTGYWADSAKNNSGFGYYALVNLTTGNENNAAGSQALKTLTTGSWNNAMGTTALYSLLSGSYNNAMGRGALYTVSVGIGNCGVGYNALRLTTGNYNVGIGYTAGYTTTGSSNVFIGANSGYYSNASNLLFIDNQQRANAAAELTDALIYGVFAAAPANQTLRLNAKVGVNMTPTAQLDVDQSNNAGAIPVACFDQADVDQVLWGIIGTAEAASADRTLVAASDFGTPGALVGWIQINVQDDGNRVADADYWIPFYATPT